MTDLSAFYHSTHTKAPEQHVVALDTGLLEGNRAFLAVRTLTSQLEEIEALIESAPKTLALFTPELDAADSKITMLLIRLRMKETTNHLCNQFGRAP